MGSYFNQANQINRINVINHTQNNVSDKKAKDQVNEMAKRYGTE